MTHRERTLQAHDDLFAAATAVIERDAHRSALSLAGVAAELAVTPRHLQRVFAEVGGTTFRRYVLTTRMERAARLLREERPARAVPTRPIREVAAMVGYSDLSSGFGSRVSLASYGRCRRVGRPCRRPDRPHRRRTKLPDV